MNEPEKFTIRINFRKKKDQAPGDDSRCHYHWGRIIGVSLAVIVTIASLISAGSYYLNQDQIDNEQVKSATNKDPDKNITSPALMPPSSQKKDTVRTVNPSPTEIDIVPDETAVIKPAAADTAPDENTVIKSALADTLTEETAVIKPAVADIIPEETAAIKSAVAETAPEENTVIKSALTDTVAEETAVINPSIADTLSGETAVITPSTVTETAPEENTVIKSALTDTVAEETAVIAPSTADTVSPVLFTQSQTNLLSANVTRFVISQTVQDNEPIGTINDIHFDDNNIATVYAYSDVTAFKDQTLYYQWSLDGKKIAKIRVYVRGDRWRSYSSKFIQPHMHGEWKVELQNQAGENLAINQFRY